MSHVLAIGGGGFRFDERWQLRPGPLVEHVLALTGKDDARVCALHTATGDDSESIRPWYGAWATGRSAPATSSCFPCRTSTTCAATCSRRTRSTSVAARSPG